MNIESCKIGSGLKRKFLAVKLSHKFQALLTVGQLW